MITKAEVERSYFKDLAIEEFFTIVGREDVWLYQKKSNFEQQGNSIALTESLGPKLCYCFTVTALPLDTEVIPVKIDGITVKIK